MELLIGYDSDSESADEEKSEKVTPVESNCVLPSPEELLKKSSGTSVFKGHFENDSEKINALEVHVKMVENKNNITEVDGRKVCWMYRQGRCRFGKKCRMFHDSELRDNTILNRQNDKPEAESPFSRNNTFKDEANEVSTDDAGWQKTKKRYGVTNTLEPPRKAMRQIKKIQESERKWRK